LQQKVRRKLLVLLAASVPAVAMMSAVPAYAATNTCTGPGNAGATCIWIDANYGSEQADFFGTNPDFTKIDCNNPLNCLPDGTWNDEGSSGYNDGGGLYNAELWQNTYYSGHNECLKLKTATANTQNFTLFGFNDQASANSWYLRSGAPPFCWHTD
jgi:hypothetical protein